MSLDTCFDDITEAGWLVNNCYQIDPHLWRVNLRRPSGTGDYFTDWAEAPTLLEALELCMDKLATAEWEEAYQPKATKNLLPEPTPSTLLTRLGLDKPKPTITRRI